MRVLHSDLGRDCGVLVDGVVDFVLGAGADLDWGVVLLVTIKTAGQVTAYCPTHCKPDVVGGKSIQNTHTVTQH